jgi:hypothetical protein
VTENPLWPERLLYASLITLLAACLQAKAILPLAPFRLLALLGFTQLLSALLVNQIGDHWYTSYSMIERLHALFIGGLSLLLGILTLRRTLDMLRDKIGEKNGLWIRYLVLAFVAVALYKSQALALNGRYLSSPYPVTCIPVAGIVGFMLIRYFVKGRNLASALELNDLFGTRTLSVRQIKTASLVLAVTGLILIVIETAFVMHNSNYEQAYPILTDRIYAAFMVTTNHSQLLGWAMLIAAALILMPLRASAYALVFMALAIIAGETYAFLIGHDFIESYPDVGERIWKAFVYTITNCQLQLWLASLLILALPLWRYREQKSIDV